MTRLTYEDIESAPQGPYLALRAMGAASAQAFFRSTLPEILPAYLTNALYLLEGNVRHSAILGYVGAGGIGLLLNEKVSWREYDKVGTILLLLFAVVYLMEHLSTWLTRLVHQAVEEDSQGDVQEDGRQVVYRRRTGHPWGRAWKGTKRETLSR